MIHYILLILMVPSFSNCIINATDQFQSLKNQKIFSINADLISFPSYTMNVLNNLGKDNHFQGITKHPHRNIYYLSGANKKSDRASLFTIEEIRGRYKITRENIVNEDAFWHLGGISAHGNYLALPIESYGIPDTNEAYIRFMDISGNENNLLSFQIHRKNKTGGALSLLKLEGKYLLIVFSDDSLDFYFSKSLDLNDGFHSSQTVSTGTNFRFESHYKDHFQASTIQLIQECDTLKYFLIAPFNNGGKLGPIFSPKNRIDFYEVNFSKSITITRILSQSFPNNQKYNFSGASGAYATPNNFLKIISTPYYRSFHFRRFGHYRLWLSQFSSSISLK